MATSFPDWREFIACLTRQQVRFIVVGAHALAALGRPRYTGDLDVFVEPTSENAERLDSALRDFGFAGAAEVAGQLAEPGKMMTLGKEPVRIDITTEMSDLTFGEAWRGKFRRRIGEHLVAFLGRREYIKNKRASAKTPGRRAGDEHDIALLEEMHGRYRRRPPARSG